MNKNMGAFIGAGFLLGLLFGMLIDNLPLGMIAGIGWVPLLVLTKIKTNR